LYEAPADDCYLGVCSGFSAVFDSVRACSGFSHRVKNGSFRHFSPFQLRSTGYAPSKTQKLTKNQPVFANGRES
jgi:hypothetical protein